VPDLSLSEIILYSPQTKTGMLALKFVNILSSTLHSAFFLLQIIDTGVSYHAKYVVNAKNDKKFEAIIVHRVRTWKRETTRARIATARPRPTPTADPLPYIRQKTQQSYNLTISLSHGETLNGTGNHQPRTLILASKRLNIGAFLSISGIIINLQHDNGETHT
jgi:hypothetical protein